MNNMTFYKYKVHWQYSDEEADLVNEGFIAATSYANAVKLLEEEGFDCIDTIEVSAINDSFLLSYEDILESFGIQPDKSRLGSQIIEALKDAIEQRRKANVSLENFHQC